MTYNRIILYHIHKIFFLEEQMGFNTAHKTKHISFTAFLLCFCLLFSSVFQASAAIITSVSGFTREDQMVPVYAYSDYKVTLKNANFVKKHADDGKMLTDRIYTTAIREDPDDPIPGWVMAESYDGKTDFRMTVTLDLGFSAKGVCHFFARCFSATDICGEMPDKLRFFISADGEEYTYVGQGSTTTDISVSYSAAVYRLTTKKEYEARYVRFVFDCKGGTKLIVNETGAAASGNAFFANCTDTGDLFDSQGLIYKVSKNSASICGVMPVRSQSNGGIVPSGASFDTDGITYTLGQGSENPVEVICDFIDTDRINYSGVPNQIKYIVIHNTGTTEEETDAARYNLRMHRTENETSWHYTVDDGIIYHSLPDSVVGWHAGSFYNYRSIGIEICTNGAPTSSGGNPVFSGTKYEKWVKERFDFTLKNTAMLTAELLTRYGLGTDAVIQHYDGTEKNCPLWLRSKGSKFVYEGTLWLKFMDYVNQYYLLLNGKSPSPAVFAAQAVVIPDFIVTPDGDVLPVEQLEPNCFSDLDGVLTKVELGKSINKIAVGCFEGSESIEIVQPHSGSTCFFTDSKNRLTDKNGTVYFDPEATASCAPSPAQDCTLDIRKIDNKYYIFFKNKTITYNELQKSYGAKDFFAFSVDGKEAPASSAVGTGATIRADGARLYTVVMGDADGNSLINAADYLMAKRTVLGTYFPLKRQVLAISFTFGDRICAADYLMLKRHVLGTYDIFK